MGLRLSHLIKWSSTVPKQNITWPQVIILFLHSLLTCVAVVITWLWDIVVVINVRIGHITFFLQSYLWIVKEVGKQGLLVHLFPHFIGENWVLKVMLDHVLTEVSFFFLGQILIVGLPSCIAVYELQKQMHSSVNHEKCLHLPLVSMCENSPNFWCKLLIKEALSIYIAHKWE